MDSHGRALTPHHLSSLCHQAQLADVDLHDGSFRDDSESRVERRRRVLLHAEDGEAERGPQLRVRDVSLLKAQTLNVE